MAKPSAIKTQAPTRREGRGDLPHLAEARRLYSLLMDGAKPAGFHLRDGYWLRNAATKKLLRSSYTSEWRPARDVLTDGTHEERKLTSYHLSYHLRGKYSVAWTAPSWTSLMVLDIDRPHVPDGADAEAHWRADAQRDETLAAVWDAFGCDEAKQPVVLATPGGGYHLYFPLCRTGDPNERERTWPAAWAREWFEYHLERAGLSLRPGTLELYPSGVRLRAPCGRGTALLAPQNPNHGDDLRLEPVQAQYITVIDGKTGEAKRSLRRRIGPMTTAFCDAIDEARRPLEAWLGNEERAWSPTWGPFGDRAPKKQALRFQAKTHLSQHKEDVSNSGPQSPVASGSEESGWLLHGRAFSARIRSLAQEGLTHSGQRHDAALKLAWHLGVVEGLGRQEILDQIREWLSAHAHVSATRGRGDRAFVEGTLREVANYYDTRVCKVERWRGRAAPKLLGEALSAADADLIERCVEPRARTAARAIMRHIKAHATSEGHVPTPLELSSKLLEELCGDSRLAVENDDGTRSRRRTSVVALEELSRLGLLAIHTNYSVGHHGRRYTCWYQFGSGVAPRETESGGRELARREVEEGTLVVELAPESHVPRARLRLRSEGDEQPNPGSLEEDKARPPWWRRMYARRAFTPADFFDNGASPRLADGPFRHRALTGVAVKGKPAVQPRAPSNSNVVPHAPPQGVGLPGPEAVSRLPDSVARVADHGLRDAIARAWAAFEDSS